MVLKFHGAHYLAHNVKGMVLRMKLYNQSLPSP